MATIHWKAGVNGSFNDAPNWNPGVVPGATDDAVITVAGSYLVTETGNNTIHKLTVGATVTLDVNATGVLDPTHGIVNAGRIVVADSGVLTLSGEIHNTGLITASHSNNALSAPLRIGSAGAGLTGGGDIILATTTPNTPTVAPAVANAAVLLTNVDNRIEGSGYIGYPGIGTLNLVNRPKGVIDANTGSTLVIDVGTLRNAGLIEQSGTGALNGTLYIDANTLENTGRIVFADGLDSIAASAVTNKGSILAIGKGLVFLGGTGIPSLGPTTIANTGLIAETGGGELHMRGGTIDNTGGGNAGALEVEGANSEFDLAGISNATTIVGGTLKAGSGGMFINQAAGIGTPTTLDGTAKTLTLIGLLDDKGVLVLKGKIRNEGTISLTANGPLEISGGVTLGGGGMVTLVPGATVSALQAGAVLTNVDNTITGSGTGGNLGGGAQMLSVVNQANGVIGPLAVTLNDLNNAGLIASAGPNGFDLHATTLENTGSILCSAGKSLIEPGVLTNGGTIAETGTGVLSVGAFNTTSLTNTGTISDAGSLTQPMSVMAQTIVNTGAGTIEATVSGGLTIQAMSLVNNGTIAALGGDVTVQSIVTGAGAATVGDGATLIFAKAATPNVSFVADTAGVLQLDQAASFTGTLTGFGPEHLLDLRDLAFGATMSASFVGTPTGGTLAVSNGAATDTYQLVGDYTQVGFAVSADGVGGTRVAESNSLFGTSGDDVLVAGPTATTLVGLGGADSYQVAVTGAGTVEVLNGAAPHGASQGQPAGELLLGTGVADNQLWLDRVDNTGAVSASGNNLRLVVMGTSQSMRVDDWFNPVTPAAPLSDMKLTDSGLKLDAAVPTLLAAMATFEANNPGFDPTAPANPTITDPGVLAAVNNSWHP
jgi:hypothetical protein